MPRKHKYNAKPTVVYGKWFASKKEAQQYLILKALEGGGKITNLQTQVPYSLTVNGVFLCKYIADFVYFDVEAGKEVVADAKGYKTDIYKLKKSLMKAIYGISIFEL